MIKQDYANLSEIVKRLSSQRQLLHFSTKTGCDYQLLRRIRDGRDTTISSVIKVEQAIENFLAEAQPSAEAGSPQAGVSSPSSPDGAGPSPDPSTD